MHLTTTQRKTSLPVLLILAGLQGTLALSMVHCALEGLQSCLRVYLLTPTQVLDQYLLGTLSDYKDWSFLLWSRGHTWLDWYMHDNLCMLCVQGLRGDVYHRAMHTKDYQKPFMCTEHHPLSDNEHLSFLCTGRYWEMVQRQKITHFYTAPTALRLLLKAGDEWVHKYDRSSLRILACGEQWVLSCTHK